jgi:uncharacterized delta-60 repeat protein
VRLDEHDANGGFITADLIIGYPFGMGTRSAVVLAAITVACGSRSDLSSPPTEDASAPPVDAGFDVTPPLGAFTLSVSPSSFTLTQGGASVQLAVHVTRLPPFAGDVSIDVPALPAGLSATSAVVSSGVTDATIEIGASPASDQGTLPTLNVRGVAVGGTQLTPLAIFVRGCPGCLDTTFGVKGKAALTDNPYMMTIDSSDRIVLGEEIDSNINAGAVARFNADGSVDSSFGSSGSTHLAYSMENMRSLSIAANGDIVLVGTLVPQNPNVPFFGLAARFTTSGAVDLGFGQSGTVLVPTPSRSTFETVAHLADGTFVSAGWYQPTANNSAANLWLAKLLASGGFDSAFGVGGATQATWNVGVDDEVTGGGLPTLIVQTGTQFLVVAPVETNDSGMSLARFNMDGSADPTFGVNGQLAAPVTMFATGLLPTSSGDLFACGGSTDSEESAFALFTPAGALDTTFGNNGILKTNPIDTSSAAIGCALQPDGNAVVFGWAYNTQTDSPGYLLRLTPNGSLDPSFGIGGVSKITFAPYTQPRAGPVIQSDGRIVVAIDAWDANTQTASQFLARYWN